MKKLIAVFVALSLVPFLIQGIQGNIFKLKEYEEVLAKNLTLPLCDFKGQTIKGLAVVTPALVRIDPYEVESLTVDNHTQTYDITNIAHGMLVDIFKALAEDCHFKYQLHSPKSNHYGTVNELENGTIQGTGLFEYLIKPTGFDMILADLNMNFLREKHTKFLPPYLCELFLTFLKK